MNRQRLVSCIAACILSIASSAPCASPSKEQKAKEAEAASLRRQIEIERDSLQNEIAQRWREKQRAVERREMDKDELGSLKEAQEKAFTDLERIKEERLVREKTVEEAQSNLSAKREEWGSVSAALEDVFGREAERIASVFPLDVENRRSDLESLRRQLSKKQDVLVTLDGFSRYVETSGNLGTRLTMTKQTVFPDAGKPVVCTIARFGNVFAYAVSEPGDCYFIRQSGRLGPDKYRIDKIEAIPLLTVLRPAFPQWLTVGSPQGLVPTDILQNDQTKTLVAGEKITEYQKIVASFKAGGATMVPLLLLPLWVVVLVIFKLVQFGGKRGRFKRQCAVMVSYIDKKEFEQALEYARSQHGIIASIAASSLENRDKDRTITEKIVRELLIEEMPNMAKFLNTLAVIAGAAPLLGLLGTISGMINLFGAVTHYGTGDPKFLAGGISEALITAKTGLAIAIPVLFIHDYLRNKRDRLQADIERYGLRILNKLYL